MKHYLGDLKFERKNLVNNLMYFFFICAHKDFKNLLKNSLVSSLLWDHIYISMFFLHADSQMLINVTPHLSHECYSTTQSHVSIYSKRFLGFSASFAFTCSTIYPPSQSGKFFSWIMLQAARLITSLDSRVVLWLICCSVSRADFD